MKVYILVYDNAIDAKDKVRCFSSREVGTEVKNSLPSELINSTDKDKLLEPMTKMIDRYVETPIEFLNPILNNKIISSLGIMKLMNWKLYELDVDKIPDGLIIPLGDNEDSVIHTNENILELNPDILSFFPYEDVYEMLITDKIRPYAEMVAEKLGEKIQASIESKQSSNLQVGPDGEMIEKGD